MKFIGLIILAVATSVLAVPIANPGLAFPRDGDNDSLKKRYILNFETHDLLIDGAKGAQASDR
jgi:hypothetical protein